MKKLYLNGAGELCLVIRDNVLGYSKPANYLLRIKMSRSLFYDLRLCFRPNPLSVIVHDYQ